MGFLSVRRMTAIARMASSGSYGVSKQLMGVISRLLAGLLLVGVLTLPVPVRAEVPAPHLGYGFMLAYPPGNLGLARDAGFDWFKYFVYWNAVDADRNRVYNWETVDWRLGDACANRLNLLLRVERDSSDWTPIQDNEMAGWQAFFQDLAGHIAQKQATCGFAYRVALEVWNEPNLDFQWSYQDVDPARYTEMVKRAYLGADAGDPRILMSQAALRRPAGCPMGERWMMWRS